jgi:hypothetical protein
LKPAGKQRAQRQAFERCAQLGLTLADTEKTFQEIALKAVGRLDAASADVETTRERIERECRRWRGAIFRETSARS